MQFEKPIYREIHKRKNITVSFAGAPGIFKNKWVLHIYFEIAIYKVLHERSNITAPFAEHLLFQEKVTFTHAIWVTSGKSK